MRSIYIIYQNIISEKKPSLIDSNNVNLTNIYYKISLFNTLFHINNFNLCYY